MATIEERELKNINKQIKQDKRNVKAVKELYEGASDEIAELYAAFYGKYADDDGIDMSIARQKATKAEIKKYKRDIKKVATSRGKEEARSNRTNNRLELLKANANLELIEAAEREEQMLQDILNKQAEDEYKRQATILGVALLVSGTWALKKPKEPLNKSDVPHIAYTKKSLNEIVNTRLDSAYNKTVKSSWNDILWTNQKDLRRDLETILERGILAGRNPRAMATELRGKVNQTVYNSERLLRTESAFVQGEVAVDSMKQMDVKQYVWVTEPDGCDECLPLDGMVFDIEEAKNAETMIPKHPQCRCSISHYVAREE